jgi:hypothetical protein
MRASLATLGAALAGLVPLTAEAEDTARALFRGDVPPAWLRHAPATCRPLAGFLAHHAAAALFFARWLPRPRRAAPAAGRSVAPGAAGAPAGG